MYSKGYPSPYSGPVTVAEAAPTLSTFEYNPPFSDWVSIPDGASDVVIEIWDGGGAGQQGGSTSSGAGKGGGGGGYIKADITGALITPGAKIHIEVGNPGLFVDLDLGDGGNTIVTDNTNYTIQANGGAFAGKGGTAPTPGYSGVTYIASDPGDSASWPFSTSGTNGGNGGGVSGGVGGLGGGEGKAGSPGLTKGAGGGGGGAFGPTDGGDGAPGLVILSYIS